jgi:peptidoglycan/LPS O-acetylase OafA/YrhL
MFLTIIFIVVTGYGSPKFDLLKIVNNILIVPLNYYMFFDNSILQEPKWWLIPPAWSLGTELQAYLILPFIIYFKPIKVVTAVLSLFIFIVASVGFIHTDHFGYRLIPGVLFIFILGVSIHKQTSDSERVDLFDIYFPAFVYGILIILLTILGIFGSILSPYIRETTLGILIGLPIIIYLAKTEVKVPMNHLFGDISYGMFLSHFLAIWIVEYCSLIDKSRHLYLYTLYIFIIALSISIVGVLIVERRVKKYRFRLSKSIKKR